MNELNIAINAAAEAGEVILKYYQSDYEIKDKGFQNPVTTADHESDNMLRKILISAYPDYGWLSEETITLLITSDFTAFIIANSNIEWPFIS